LAGRGVDLVEPLRAGGVGVLAVDEMTNGEHGVLGSLSAWIAGVPHRNDIHFTGLLRVQHARTWPGQWASHPACRLSLQRGACRTGLPKHPFGIIRSCGAP